ncbi:helix-turn-helix transcriptional regulator [Candidatus Bipolaricaulota bacterium]|nr:helix-turn-helix transcriptional regulator [Candidatus Bipolaricaulota bacterium]
MNLKKAEKLLGTVASKTRLRLLRTMIDFDDEICVCEFEDALELPQYSVSRHLNKLKERNLVESRREGTWAYYSLYSELEAGTQGIISWLENNIQEESLKEDKISMENRLALRDNGKCVTGCDEESGRN